MLMAVTVLNPDPKSWNVYEFDGDKSSNIVMIDNVNFLLINTKWYLRWRDSEFGYKNWIENHFTNKKQIDFPRLDAIVRRIRREKQISEIIEKI